MPKHSAIIPGYNEVSIPADHVGMTKFSGPADVGYKRVSGELGLWIRDIHRQAQEAAPVGDSAKPSSRTPANDSGSQAERSERNAGPVMNFNGSMTGVGNLYQGSFGSINVSK